jgi:hypothetical protein
MKKLLLATAFIAFSTPVWASASLGDCVLPAHTEVKTMPVAKGHGGLWYLPQDVDVMVSDTYQDWVWISGEVLLDPNFPNSKDNVAGWVLRSSLKKCHWNRR